MAHPADMALLVAIAGGRVVRVTSMVVVRGGGTDTTALADYLLDGRPVRLDVVRLAREDLVTMPLSGPPRLAPRGVRLLRGGQ